VSLGISVVNGRPTPEVILYRETELDTREINCRKREKQLGGGGETCRVLRQKGFKPH
jgi:hypothetical protein